VIDFNNLLLNSNEAELLKKEVFEVVNSGQYLMGQKTKDFESSFSKYLGVDFVVSCANGTDALYLAFASLNLDKGAQIVMTANCGMYSASVVVRLGLVPLFVDIDIKNGQINLDQFYRCLTKETKAVVITHLYGIANNMHEIKNICENNDVLLIEDVSQACGGEFDGQKLGSFGDVSTFSFYPTKNLGSFGDAGAVVTSNHKLNLNLRKLRQYGWSERYYSELSGGINSRIDEIQAGVLSIRLKSLDATNEIRYQIFRRYLNSLSSSNMSFVGSEISRNENVAHLAVLRSEKRNELKEVFRKLGIQTAIHYPIPDHKQQSLIGKFKIFNSLEQTELFSNQILSIPCHPNLTDDDLNYICEILGNLK
jgi:aminotransferase EvaB